MTSITAILSVTRRRHALAAAALGALLAMPSQAQTTQRIPVSEIKPLLALAAEPGIGELKPFSEAAKAKLHALADGLSVADAQRVKDILVAIRYGRVA